MAGRVNLVASPISLTLLLAMPGVVAHAQSLPDPTRPAYAIEGAATDGAAGSNRLSSIVRPQGGRPYAVIDGKVVRLGGQVGEARLARISEHSVELHSAGGTETLSLTPGIDKTKAMPAGRVPAGRNPS